MPGFNDTEVIAVYPTYPKDAFRVPTVEKAVGFDVHLEAEAGNGKTGPDSITPYTASVQVFNVSRGYQPVTTTAPPNAKGNIGVGQTWNTNDQAFIFSVPAGSKDIHPGDLIEIVGILQSGNPGGAATNDFSYVKSDLFLVI